MYQGTDLRTSFRVWISLEVQLLLDDAKSKSLALLRGNYPTTISHTQESATQDYEVSSASIYGSTYTDVQWHYSMTNHEDEDLAIAILVKNEDEVFMNAEIVPKWYNNRRVRLYGMLFILLCLVYIILDNVNVKILTF